MSANYHEVLKAAMQLTKVEQMAIAESLRENVNDDADEESVSRKEWVEACKKDLDDRIDNMDKATYCMLEELDAKLKETINQSRKRSHVGNS